MNEKLNEILLENKADLTPETHALTANTKPVKSCQFISAYNDSWTVTKWQVIDAITNQVVYTSGKYTRDELFSCEIKDIPGAIDNVSRYYFKAAVEVGSDSTANVILQFTTSIANTARFTLTGTAFNTTLTCGQ